MTNEKFFDHHSCVLKILWVVQGVEGKNPSEAKSELASNRYRAILPAQSIQDLGHEVYFVPHTQNQWISESLPDIVVVGKLLIGGDALNFQKTATHVLLQIKNLQKDGVVVLADFNDDHFEHPVMGAYWKNLAQTVDFCVTGTEPMAELVQKFSDKPVSVIGDPIAAPFFPARTFKRKGAIERKIASWVGAPVENYLQLIWYGNLVNWPTMELWIEELTNFNVLQGWFLRVVTRRNEKILNFIEKFNLKNHGKFFIEFNDWSEEAQWNLVKKSHIVLIPSNVNDGKKVVKTSNRLTDALYAGCYVIASPLPSYLPYADVVCLTDNPKFGLEDYVQSPDACLEKIQQGQKMVSEQFSIIEITDLWIDSMAVALDSKARQKPAANLFKYSEKIDAIRLNLGCGDKIIEGYINVDVVPSRLGKAPDILSDLKDLSVFSDNYADEILAVHVIEHFWRWEVEDTLREWVRVLKPGGQIILECPNLVSACEEFLRDPEKYAAAGPEGQRTMWVFYGDPAWKDPYMIHRWGYTPSSLSQLMQKVGLINVRQESAQFKLKEPRDMRIVGEKIAIFN